MLWELNQRWYEDAGPGAWLEQDVPCYITSNAVIAHAYARVALGLLEDAERQQPGRTDPVHIVECAAGMGKFTFLFLAALDELIDLSPHPHAEYHYIATDVVPANLTFIERRPQLKPFVEEGRLSVAPLDLMAPELPVVTDRPVMLITNYVLDSIAPDAFEVRAGELFELQVRLKSDIPEPRLDQIAVEFVQARPPRPVYGDAILDGVLEDYEARLGDTAFLLPVNVIVAMRRLAEQTPGGLLILGGDKGYNHIGQITRMDEPHVAYHGSVSVLVNFDGIGRAAELMGGWSMHSAEREAQLSISSFALGLDKAALPSTRCAFEAVMEPFGPVDWFEFYETLKLSEPLTVAQCLSYLRMSRWDADLFGELASSLQEGLDDLDEEVAAEIRGALHHVARTIYPLPVGPDIAFAIGLSLYGMDRFPDALAWFQRSLEWYGPSGEAHHNVGLCAFALGQPPVARAAFDAALSLDPGYGPSREGLIRLDR